MTSAPVQGRIDISTARQKQPVKLLKEFLPTRLTRRQEDRQSAGSANRLYVLGTKREPVILISPVARNANQGSCHSKTFSKYVFFPKSVPPTRKKQPNVGIFSHELPF